MPLVSCSDESGQTERMKGFEWWKTTCRNEMRFPGAPELQVPHLMHQFLVLCRDFPPRILQRVEGRRILGDGGNNLKQCPQCHMWLWLKSQVKTEQQNVMMV